MSYPKCPSCRTKFSNKILLYEKRIEEIENKNIDLEKKKEEKRDLLNELHIFNICCRMRFLTYCDKTKIIK